MTYPLLITILFVAAASTASAQTPQDEAVKFSLSGVSKTIDCGGKDLTVTGDRNSLGITNCSTITIVGNRNQVRAQLLPASAIAAVGNDNHIVFLHAPGFEARVTSSGKGNEIVPNMDRDLTQHH